MAIDGIYANVIDTNILYMDCTVSSRTVGIMPTTKELLLSEGRVVTYCVASNGPTVLLLHGNSSAKEIFLHQIRMLRRFNYGIVAPDLPGHGMSDNARKPTQTYSIPGYTRVIQTILDALNLRTVHFVGWSLGGHIGLELLARDRRVRSLMIFGAPPITPGPRVITQGFFAIPEAVFAGQRVLNNHEARQYGEYAVGGKRYLTKKIVETITRTDGRARYWLVKNTIQGKGTDEVKTVANSNRLVAIVHGRHDPFVDGQYLATLTVKNLWRGSIQMIDAGHAPHWQRPRIFNRLLAAFLKDAVRF